MSVTDAAQQCNRDFNHWRKVVDLVKEVRQELCQGRLRAFPEERFVLVSGLIFSYWRNSLLGTIIGGLTYIHSFDWEP